MKCLWWMSVVLCLPDAFGKVRYCWSKIRRAIKWSRIWVLVVKISYYTYSRYGICHGKPLSSCILNFASHVIKNYIDICWFTLSPLYVFLHLKVNQELEEILCAIQNDGKMVFYDCFYYWDICKIAFIELSWQSL